MISVGEATVRRSYRRPVEHLDCFVVHCLPVNKKSRSKPIPGHHQTTIGVCCWDMESPHPRRNQAPWTGPKSICPLRSPWLPYRTTSVTQLITTLGWDSLHVWRLLSQSTMFYKIHHGLVNIQFPPVIHPSSYFGSHDHQLKYHLPDASVDSYKFSFYLRAVKIWNQLPAVAVSSTSTTAFQEADLPAIRELRPPAGGSRLL